MGMKVRELTVRTNTEALWIHLLSPATLDGYIIIPQQLRSISAQ